MVKREARLQMWQARCTSAPILRGAHIRTWLPPLQSPSTQLEALRDLRLLSRYLELVRFTWITSVTWVLDERMDNLSAPLAPIAPYAVRWAYA